MHTYGIDWQSVITVAGLSYLLGWRMASNHAIRMIEKHTAQARRK